MHYIMSAEEPLSPNGEALMEIHNHFRVGGIRLWASGRRHRQDVPVPIQIAYDTFRGYMGPPMELLDVGIPIMSARLAAVITACGVSSIDFYDAVLVHNGSGARFDYKAFNVVSMVAAADLERSGWSNMDGSPLIDTQFTKLVIDEGACQDLLLFRLAENCNAIVVHSSVRDAILSEGITGLTFTDPERWMHL